ncbi:MAG: sulfite exporter TauE/SafE family protein [Zetaproteobacteria bacterium]|jgi:uncharacterized protein|nr:MAG: sulfite exporter TauE/SafE family protein [Zetaproteobacteria bacterium]
MEITWVAVAGAFLLASFVKGTTGMGFPLIATPMVALLVDLRTAYALLVLPNILMDTLQMARGSFPWPIWRRLSRMLAATAVGVFLGTRIFVSVSERFIYLALAAMIFVFLVSVYLRIRLTVPPGWEGRLGPAVGFTGGVLAGVTNVVGPITALYLLALGFEKREFVKAVASIFFITKASQLVAISRWGLYTAEILWWSVGLAAVALVAFWVGLRVQDRVPQATFGRIVNVLLFGMGIVFIYRGTM